MSRKNIIGLIVPALALVAAATFAHFAHATLPADAERVPLFELRCEGISDVLFTDVLFTDDGTLTAGGHTYHLQTGRGATLTFSDGVILTGIAEGESVFFDTSTLTIRDRSYSCTVE